MIVTERERERERERGRDIGRGRSRLHAPGARRGIRSRVSRITPWAEGGPKPRHPGCPPPFFLRFYLLTHGGHRERQTGEADSMHREPDVGFDPGSPGSRPGLKAGAKPLRHPGFPKLNYV